MRGKIRGFLRDAWWLLPIVIGGALFLGIAVAPVLGIAVLLSGLGVCFYFAMMRYDADGNEIPQGPG